MHAEFTQGYVWPFLCFCPRLSIHYVVCHITTFLDTLPPNSNTYCSSYDPPFLMASHEPFCGEVPVLYGNKPGTKVFGLMQI